MGANCFGRKGKKEVIMTNYTFFTLSSSCSVSVKLFLKHSSLQSHLIPVLGFWFFIFFLPYYLYFLDKTCTFAYLSHFKGWDDELHCLVLSITVSLVVMSLIIFKDNAFSNRFNPNLSIIMIEDDILSYICEAMVHFSSLHAVFQILCSCHITLVCNFTKQWMWLFTKLISKIDFKRKQEEEQTILTLILFHFYHFGDVGFLLGFKQNKHSSL